MSAIPKRLPPPVVRTRGAFRREYEATIPEGCEATALAEATAELDATRERLRELRARRVDLVRKTAEHVRKLHDWKGKVPRPLGAPIPSVEVADPSAAMPCRVVARVRETRSEEMEDGQLCLVFSKPYVRALEGVERFDKAWVIGMTADCGGGGGAHRSWNNPALRMVLVDVVERRGRNAQNKEVLVVRDGGGDALESLIGVSIVDVKPYLSYCEAHAEEEGGAATG
jgi:tRNA (Thr-GGU) A37 N-methylase